MNEDFENDLIDIGLDYDPNDVIELEDTQGPIDVDIIVSKKKRFNFKFLLIIPLMVIGVLIFIAALVLSNNKIVPYNVVGASFSFSNISLVPNEYQISPGDIKVGSQVIHSESSKPFFGPFLRGHSRSEVGKYNDLIVYLKQKGSKDLERINMYEILYVIKD